MFTIGNDELNKCPPLKDYVYCPTCRQWHDVELTDILAFCKCVNKAYLVGLNGKMISPRFLNEEPIDES